MNEWNPDKDDRDDLNKYRKGGLEPDPDYDKHRPCRHREHDPPSHIYIPPGMRLRHICPGCGEEQVIYPAAVSH